MAFFEELVGEGKPSAHNVVGALRMIARSELTRAGFEAMFELDTNDADLTTIINVYTASTKKAEFTQDFEWIMGLAQSGLGGMDDRTTFFNAINAIG